MKLEQRIFKAKFPDEEFDIDNFYDWAKENESEAIKMCFSESRELQKSHDELLEAAEMFFDRMPTDWGDLIFNGRLNLNIDADAVDAIESAIKNATK
jgi:hypothetical protein